MYFPYLYARRSELLALRAMVADHRPLENFVPVIEPVVSNPADVKKVIEEYGKAGHRLAVVLNPEKHELGHSGAFNAWYSDVAPLVKANASILPALRCVPGVSRAYAQAFIAEFADREVVLAYESSPFSDADVTTLASVKSVRFHLVLNGKMSVHQQGLLPKGKRVDVQDRFEKLTRNADYGLPEFFTDRNSTFRKDLWAGFGDYCCIGSDLAIGGGPAAAVAIHATYKRKDGGIWVEHFVSDDVERDIGDTASKFLQAARKLVKAANARPKEFSKNFALGEFEAHVKRSHSPGLGKSKELQTSHHMCLMLDILSGAI